MYKCLVWIIVLLGPAFSHGESQPWRSIYTELEQRATNLKLEKVGGLIRLAEEGNFAAQYILGSAYLSGSPIQRDKEKGIEWLEKAAEQGLSAAHYKLFLVFGTGTMVERNPEKALAHLTKAAESDNSLPEAQFAQGRVYENRGEFQSAAKQFEKSAASGYVPAVNAMGYYYENGKGVEKDLGKAVEWYRIAAQAGDANAQSNLGNMYQFGWGVETNYSEAFKWFSKSAENGWAYGQINLAAMYMSGKGVEKDFGEAYKWVLLAARHGYDKLPGAKPYDSETTLNILKSKLTPEEIEVATEKAREWMDFKYPDTSSVGSSARLHEITQRAVAGDAHAQSMLGEAYYKQGNYAEAFEWVKKSADQGYSYGQYNLGVLYAEGSGTPQNYERALELFTLSAEQGNTDSMNNIAMIHYFGRGVPKSALTAYRWWYASVLAGSNLYEKNLQAIRDSGELSDENIKQAELKVEEWLRKFQIDKPGK